MKVGITAYGLPPGEDVALARAAERLGYSSYWLGEHLLHPVAYGSSHPGEHQEGEPVRDRPIIDTSTQLSDPLAVLSAIAGSTSRLELGTAIYLLALRHPLVAARAAMTVQRISGGRFLFGLGTGWLEEELTAVGVPFGERIARFDEGVEVLRQAWRGGPFEIDGRWVSTGGLVQLTPEPCEVPVVFGGNTERALDRAARAADGWFASGTPALETFLRLRDRLEARRSALGRQGPFRYFVRVELPEAGHLEPYRTEGVDEVLVWARSPYPVGDRGSVWPEGPAEAQKARLAEVARDLGLTAP